MELESEDGIYEDLFDEIDEDADAIGAAFTRGEAWANEEMVQEWANDVDY